MTRVECLSILLGIQKGFKTFFSFAAEIPIFKEKKGNSLSNNDVVAQRKSKIKKSFTIENCGQGATLTRSTKKACVPSIRKKLQQNMV